MDATSEGAAKANDYAVCERPGERAHSGAAGELLPSAVEQYATAKQFCLQHATAAKLLCAAFQCDHAATKFNGQFYSAK